MLVGVAEERVYKVWLVQKNGYQLDGYYEAADECYPEPDDVIRGEVAERRKPPREGDSFKPSG